MTASVSQAAHCRGCGDPIAWCEVANSHKRIPLDLDPGASDRGNVRVVDGRATVLGELEAYAARQSGEALWLAHFVRCPKAAEFRRR